ncbi:DUF983 domain-containing protein [soil metagenome]
MNPRLISIFKQKCPRCLEGDLFIDPNPYHLKETSNMYEHCPKCNLTYAAEPGYWYGAMYVSYAFTVALAVGLFLLYYLFFSSLGIAWYLGGLTVTLLGLAPWTFRTSRAIWLNFFNKYHPEVRAGILKKT